MPHIEPPGGPVDWPADEKTLGVVGVAPFATMSFCEQLYARIRAEKDWHFPRVLLDINPKLPSRGRHLQLDETDPSPTINATIAELAAQGADIAVVVCNTAHILYDRWGQDAPIPTLHIVQEAVKAANERVKSVVAWVSKSLAASGLYPELIEAEGLRCAALSPENQRRVEELIETVKQHGALTAAHDADVHMLLDEARAQGAEGVILGCTELSVLIDAVEAAGLVAIDSNAALADAVLEALAGDGDTRLRPSVS